MYKNVKNSARQCIFWSVTPEASHWTKALHLLKRLQPLGSAAGNGQLVGQIHFAGTWLEISKLEYPFQVNVLRLGTGIPNHFVGLDQHLRSSKFSCELSLHYPLYCGGPAAKRRDQLHAVGCCRRSTPLTGPAGASQRPEDRSRSGGGDGERRGKPLRFLPGRFTSHVTPSSPFALADVES